LNLLFQICLIFILKYNETCETTKYPPDQSTLAPTYVVNLDLPPEQRWVELAKKYKGPITDLVVYIKKFILEFSPKLQKIINLVDNDLVSLIFFSIQMVILN
jgi:hypothetical protein